MSKSDPSPEATLVDDRDIVKELSPTQEHFLKKYILESRLYDELHHMNDPEVCKVLGPPFRTNPEHIKSGELPLLSFFFDNYLTTFPFLTNNTKKDQASFWQDTVQPFIESFNSKHISSSEERQEKVTKRRQVNKKFLSGLLLYYNSVIITEQDMTYLQESHLKASDAGKLDKLHIKNSKIPITNVALDAYDKMAYNNDKSINIVAVRKIFGKSGEESSVSGGRYFSSWIPFSRLGSSAETKPRHNYEFIIQVTSRKESTVDPFSDDKKPKKNYTYSSHFISRPYHEFKNLESVLKKEFPGLMSTEGPSLPQKAKHDEGFLSTDYTKSSFDSERSEFSDLIGDSGTRLVREKLRLALRGYLTSLSKFPEIANSSQLEKFLFDPEKSFSQLTPSDEADYESRIEHEKQILKTQIEFQQQTAAVTMQLTKDFEHFKESLVMNPETITQIFTDIGKSPNIQDLSPLLKTFNEWCKLEVAATLYQVFLGQDNSNEWLNKCKRFHFMFPYTVVYGILKFTNPVKVTSRVIDLLLVNFPRFSFPSWGGGEPKENGNAGHAQKSGGARNLLSMIFIMLLDEDLSDFEKELKALKEEKLKSEYQTFLARIEAYVHMDYDYVLAVKNESLERNQDLLLTVLSSSHISPTLDDKSDLILYDNIVESYQAYESLEREKDLDKSALYLNLKQYWQVLVRKKDKDLFKELWSEPELTKLIKNFLTIFYQPLMKLFAKSDMHVVFRSFQKFMDDLMKELNVLSKEEMYFLSAIEIFERLKKLLDKHEGAMWGFIHNVYVKDDQHLFLNLIKWIESILSTLRLKFVDEEKVKLIMSTEGLGIDPELFKKQLNSIAFKVIQKRKLFKEYMEKKAQESPETTQERLDQQWDRVNDEMFADVDVADFGVGSADVEDFNYLHIEGTFESDSAGGLERELKQKLYQLENGQEEHGTSELDKLDHALKPQLAKLLKGIPVEVS